jgi:hypothetical protein
MAIHHENVFWISGQSSLLSAVFLFGAIIVFIHSWSKTKISSVLYQLAGTLCMIISMLSYDGMLVAPVIVWVIGLLYGKKQALKGLWIILFVPLYLWARQYVHALPPSGDYAVNMQKIPFNVFGNVSAYLSSMVIGPKAIEYSESLRATFKTQLSQMKYILGIIGFISIALGIVLRKKFIHYKASIVWVVAGCISLTAFAGLGGSAERYALFASGFFIIAFVTFVDTWMKRGMHVFVRIFLVILATDFLVWNIMEMARIGSDWEKAYSVSRQTLLTMKKEFFPLNTKGTFIFVNTPIRYGRAWIFPTGMDDAMWHLFRGSDYTVIKGKDVPSALDYVFHNGDLYVLNFDNYKILRMTKEVQIIEEP